MGWLFSLFLFFIASGNMSNDYFGMLFIAAGLFAIAGAIGLKSFK